ncbi:RecX family transcriptional regulator [Candidatus Saccharibacteria bacterium]|nr:RecX family transcriptional regulator [Candidatus Saccharibacteria bacterium]
MEIINLSDRSKAIGEALSEPDLSEAAHLSEYSKARGGAQAGEPCLNRTRAKQPTNCLATITSVKPSPRNENRVNIFIDDEFAFSLDLAQVVEYKLKVGQTLDPAELEKLKKASNFGKLYQRTLEWALSRPHSVRETKDYLKKKQFEKPEYGITDEDIEKVVETLIKKQYLDDRKFAAYYLENRFQKKGISKKRLELELQKKGISPEIVAETFENSPRDETAEIQKIIERKRKKYDDEQLIQYLVRQGFDYQLSKSLVA